VLENIGLLFGIPNKPSIQKFACFCPLYKTKWQWNIGQFAVSLEEMISGISYGPATIQDLSHWSGLPIFAFSEVFDKIESGLSAVTLDKRTYYSYGSIEVKNTRRLSLLGKFDPLFVSYRHKDWIVNAGTAKTDMA